MSKRKTYKTNPPAISDAEIARVRAAAHRYLLAGGSIYLDTDGSDRDEHIATVRDRLRPKIVDVFTKQLEASLPSGQAHHATHEDHEDVWSAAWDLVGVHGEAGYLFGLCVGLELATMTTAKGRAR